MLTMLSFKVVSLVNKYKDVLLISKVARLRIMKVGKIMFYRYVIMFKKR